MAHQRSVKPRSQISDVFLHRNKSVRQSCELPTSILIIHIIKANFSIVITTVIPIPVRFPLLLTIVFNVAGAAN